MHNQHLKPVETNLNYATGHDKQISLGTGEYYLHPWDPVSTTIHDARGSESQFSLDKSGFQFLKHAFSATNWKDDDCVISVAYPEAIDLLKDTTGATRVIPIDHRVRLSTFESAINYAKSHQKDEYVNVKPPARLVHVDQSYDGAHAWLYDNMPDPDFDTQLKQTRWAIINIWRPLKTVYRDSFAVSDGSTIPDSCLVPLPTLMSNGKGKYGDLGKADSTELWVAKKGSGHKWWYLSEMRPDEVVLVKCFDSKVDGRVRRAPHSAFEDERYKDGEARESLEVRCLVFWEREGAE